MRLVTDCEDSLYTDATKPSHGGLQIVQRLPHIPLSCKDQSLDAFWITRDRLGLDNNLQSRCNLMICQARKAYNRTAGLNGLYDLT
jgi:hypothetical protein